MQKPTLNKMCETFIKIGAPSAITHDHIFQVIKTKVYLAISQIKKDGLVDWYSFLIHNKDAGNIPTTVDDVNFYFHIRFSLSENNNLESVMNSLPSFCLMTRKVDPASIESISIGNANKFNTSLLKQEVIEEVWRTIGEQSEFFLNAFERYKDDVAIPVHEIWALLHYFHNMVGLSAQCPQCKTILL